MDSDGDSRDVVPADSGPSLSLETRAANRPTVVPAIVAAGGDRAMRRFLEFIAVRRLVTVDARWRMRGPSRMCAVW